MGKVLEIVKEPDPRLRQRSKEVGNAKSEEIQALILDLVATMIANDGVGIAAAQVGINLRVCIVKTSDGPVALVNPEIISKSKKTELDEEGCLSIPHVFGLVARHKKIKVKALAPSGEKLAFSAEALFARIIQHEVDHLDGVLFTDRAEKTRQTTKY